MPLIRVFDVGARLEQSLEDEVLDQVGGGQLCAARVQRLEDLLRVLVGGQVDDDDLKQLPHDGLDRAARAANIAGAVSSQPLARLLAEEPVRLDHPFAAVAEGVVVDRRLCAP